MSLIFEVQKLSKDFKQKTGVLHALQNINLQVEEGDIYGIIGLSGAGKSTLIRCLNLLETPDSGSIYFNGKPLFIDDVSLQSQYGKNYKTVKKQMHKALNGYRQQMGMIFQGFNLFDQKTVFQNISYPLEISSKNREALLQSDPDYVEGRIKAKDVIRKRVKELLQIVSLEEKIDQYPSQLSGGQQQRVAIARALANNPKVLLCDEPTSALDPQTTDQILELLKDINKKLGVTVIVITHEMRIVDAICNKVSIIDQSKIAETGYVREIFRNPQTPIARQLILPGASLLFSGVGNRFIRIVYDGSVYEPIIAKLIIECKCEVSILSSNIKNYEGKIYGQMIIQVPDDDQIFNTIIAFLSSHGAEAEEVREDDFNNPTSNVE